MDYEVVGKPIPRMDALEKATGGAVYGVDVKLPGLLHAKILRSPLPHARILNIDTSRAQRLLGVKAVVTGQDFPVTYGSALQDQPVLAIDRVRYVGEGVAAVAAVDEDVAEEALSLIRVEYEKLPAVFDPREAMQEGAVLVHPDLHTYPKDTITRPLPGTNVCHYFTLRHGDVNEGFAQADLIFEDTFTSQMVQHCSLEPNVAVAQVDATGKITLWSSTQAPYVVRRELADSMGMPMTHIRVICP
ncbi:MAG: molybdopterin-dependent oxidoreductase, partial [Chloroflexi bacterium]|nr:molybdopterin-dependent oxidoreductase [Chloroflexota bacterium]